MSTLCISTEDHADVQVKTIDLTSQSPYIITMYFKFIFQRTNTLITIWLSSVISVGNQLLTSMLTQKHGYVNIKRTRKHIFRKIGINMYF